MIALAAKEKCTGCGACAYICPKNCIEMREDGMHVPYPHINHENCLQCGQCQKICPVLFPVGAHTPTEVYAARSRDGKEAFSSASGGVACTLYRDAVKEGSYIAGAVQAEDFSVRLEAGRSEDLVEKFKNSKYVFSTACSLYPEVARLLKQGEKIIIAALPCQIAAVRKIFKDDSRLYLIDVVCHGVTPADYLRQHIKSIEKETGQSAVKMYFRDPRTYTYTFTFTLYNAADERFYAKRTKDGDTYQYGYHRAVSYRENCYHCPFARTARVGDISLADYPGLGKDEPFPFEKRHINCVLINTEKGRQWFEGAIRKGLVEAYRRTLEEAVSANRQLREPFGKSRDRLRFEELMRRYEADFEKAMSPITRRGLKKEKLHELAGLLLRSFGKLKRMIQNDVR